MVKFKKVDTTTFMMNHDDAFEALEEDNIPTTIPHTFGEVKIPDHGWCPCTLNEKGEPSFFYTEDDLWQECPKVKFTKI